MIGLLQRVTSAEVAVDSEAVGAIGRGEDTRPVTSGFQRLCSVLLSCALSACIAPIQAHETTGAFTFGVLGDAPYNDWERDRVAELIDDMNREPLAFVLHAGDFKNGSSSCDDAMFRDRLELFQRSRHAFIYTPGDNEWTDCHRLLSGGYDPIERLNRLREIFFRGETSLGENPIALTRQSTEKPFGKFRENVRWEHQGVVFAALHVVGSNNNRGRDAQTNLEYVERSAATIHWLREAFEAAKAVHARGVVLLMQANPNFARFGGDAARSGYREFVDTLREETVAFGKPVLLIHGDTHHFRVDRPLRGPMNMRVANLLRVETFGSPSVNWIRVTVDPRTSWLFRVATGFVRSRPR
jgi:hypothetical protein